MFSAPADCVQSLGVADGRITDQQMTASSSRGNDLPHFGRLDNTKYWCAGEKNKEQYLQIDLGKVKLQLCNFRSGFSDLSAFIVSEAIFFA